MANLTDRFAAALMFVCAAGLNSVAESPRMALVSALILNSSTSGILMPGGSWTSTDGVVISDPENQLRSPANIFVEPLNPASVAEPIDEAWTPVRFFRIGASPCVGGLGGSFHLTFPLPQSESESELKKYAVFALLRDVKASSEEGKDVMDWMYFSEKKGVINRQIGGNNSVLTDTVFVIAKSKNSLMPSSIGQNSPRLEELLIQNSSMGGTLAPGGNFTSKDGVRIVAPVRSISSPVEITVTKRNEPAEFFGLLPCVFEVVAIYEVKSNPIAGTYLEDLQLYFPVPKAADLQQYALLQLSYPGGILDSSGSSITSWSYSSFNDERLTEIKEEENTIDIDYFMIAKANYPRATFNSVPKNTKNQPDSQPK
jgi:hypothetical protein